MRIELFACMLCLAAASIGMQSNPLKVGGPFNGVWRVTVTPTEEDMNKVGVRKFDETLTFHGNQLSAATLADRGFAPAEYQEDSRAVGPAQFTCTQSSEKEGSAAWSGLTTGQDLQGTLVLTKKDGTVVHYAFQGTKG